MSKELECPYCEHMNNVPNDCCESDTSYEKQCSNCQKNFGFSLEYYPSYTEYILPCANGEDHDYQPVREYLKSNRVRCTYCGWEQEKTDEQI